MNRRSSIHRGNNSRRWCQEWCLRSLVSVAGGCKCGLFRWKPCDHAVSELSRTHHHQDQLPPGHAHLATVRNALSFHVSVTHDQPILSVYVVFASSSSHSWSTDARTFSTRARFVVALWDGTVVCEADTFIHRWFEKKHYCSVRQ
jgi:hypothetical protein